MGRFPGSARGLAVEGIQGAWPCCRWCLFQLLFSRQSCVPSSPQHPRISSSTVLPHNMGTQTDASELLPTHRNRFTCRNQDPNTSIHTKDVHIT